MPLIELTRGMQALVDEQDHEALSAHKWCAQKGTRTFYAVRGVATGVQKPKRRIVLMHVVILGTPPGMDTDHINGNGLDNRRMNLRIVTRQKNLRNITRKRSGCTSQYRGVSWYARGKVWQAFMTVDYKAIYLGRFKTEVEAALAYDAACAERDPEHFTPNFVLSASNTDAGR